MKRAIFFVLLLVFSISSYCQNLVVNPGFETWTKTTRPDGWTHVENCSIDSGAVISGNYACLHTGGTSSTSDLGQTIPVIPGIEYNLSLFNRTIITSNGKGSRIWCYWKDADNNSIDDPITNDILRPSQYFESDAWQHFSIYITAPPDAFAFYLEVRTNTNSIAYWDDFVFKESVATLNYERYEPTITIFPNPASNYLIISNLNKLRHIDIQNLAGITIWSDSFCDEEMVKIAVSGLPDGIYIIRIITSERRISRKFIKKAN